MAFLLCLLTRHRPVVYAEADREIYTIKPDGGGKHQVIDNTTANFNPYWGGQ